MAGRGQHVQPHVGADLDDLAVPDAGALEAHRVGRIDQVGGTSLAGQCEAAADVIVVDVSLGDVRDACACRVGQRRYPVGVALRVDDDGHVAVMHQVTAVTESRRLNRDHFDHGRYPPEG
jgi:hypothetical protein